MRTSFEDPASEEILGCGEIDNLPGCSQVAVFHNAFVLFHHRNRGLGFLAHMCRLRIAKDKLYDVGICTVDSSNEYQIKNLIKAKWTKVWEFVSSKTQHTVHVYMRNLDSVP